MDKKCSKCKEVKLLSNYSLKSHNKKDGRAHYCKECEKIVNKERHLRYTENNPKCKKTKLNRDYYTKYGINTTIYFEMLIKQNNRCLICKQESLNKLAVDHCHKTGRVRGLLCSNCNWGLGNLKDNIDYLLNAISYLKAFE